MNLRRKATTDDTQSHKSMMDSISRAEKHEMTSVKRNKHIENNVVCVSRDRKTDEPTQQVQVRQWTDE